MTDDFGSPPATDPAADRAELSSVASITGDILDRVVQVAERWQAIERMDIAGDLFEAERSMRTAERRMRRVMRSLEAESG